MSFTEIKYNDNIKDEFKLIKPSNWNKLKFFEKIYYYAKNLNKNYSVYVDKIEVKKIVNEIINKFNLELKVAKVLKYMNSYEDLSQQDIMNNCIIKTSHASGWNFVINENNYDLSNIIKKLKSFNKKFIHAHEKQYSYIQPRFYIEEIINDKYLGKNGNALVYMIRCIYGKAICVNMKLDGKQNYFTIDWKPFYVQELPYIEKPKKLDLLIQIAEKLSEPFEFVRMDFYIDKNDDIYFSEYTFTPNAGKQVFSDELELSLGKLWN